MKDPLISVIIVNWNGKNKTIGTINSLLKSTYKNFEIIVADNNSQDGSREALSKFDKVIVFNTGGNLGFGKAANLAYKNYSRGDIIFICSYDSEIEPSCFEKLVKASKVYPEHDIFSPVEYELSNKNKIQQFGFKIDFFGFSYNMLYAKSLKDIKDDEIMYLPGGSLFIRKRVLDKIGLYDEDYFAFVEDMDFNWRAQIAGFKLKIVKDAKFYHLGYSGLAIEEDKIKYSVLRKRILSERNYLNSILKNFQIYTLIFVIPFYFLSNILEMLYFLSKGKIKFVLVYPGSWLWNIKLFGNLIRKRRVNRILRQKSDLEIYPKIYKGWCKLTVMRKENVPGM